MKPAQIEYCDPYTCSLKRILKFTTRSTTNRYRSTIKEEQTIKILLFFKRRNVMRILILGNSYTSANHLPLMLAEMTGTEVVAHTRGGARLAEQLNPATKLGNKTLKALHDEKWDYVILQEMSNGPITSKEKFMTNLSKLCGLIRENGAIPVLFATWAYEKNGKQLKKFGMEYEDMICSMKETFREAAKRTSCLLADVTTAFEQQAETVKLYAPDGSHPSETGSKIAARTIAKVIWNDQKRKKEVS